MPKRTPAAMPRRIEYMPIEELTPADRNPKGHDRPRIASSITRFGFADASILDERTGRLVAGHGRLEDLLTRKAEGQAPPEGIVVDDEGRWLMPVQRGCASRSDEDAEAFLVAHNRLTETGGWDTRELAELLEDLGDVDPDLLALTGFTEDDVDAMIREFDTLPGGDGPGTGDGGPERDPDRYTTAVNIPQYEPVGPPPPVSELIDTGKVEELLAGIDQAEDVPEEVAEFLRAAAWRHARINYRKVAEFYPHAPAHVQALIEASALVIIDVDDAIAGGYVRLTETLAELHAQSRALYDAGYRYDQDGRLPEDALAALRDGEAS